MGAKTTIHKGIELWNAHDRDGYRALVDDSVVFLDRPTGRQLTGREELGKGFYDLNMDAYPGQPAQGSGCVRRGRARLLPGARRRDAHRHLARSLKTG